MRSAFLVVALAAVAALVVPAAAADAEHGRQLFVACAACHSDRPDALGPNLKGVLGRKAGGREDFRYSNPMKRAGFTWDEGNLREYLADPKDIDDVVAYLATLK